MRVTIIQYDEAPIVLTDARIVAVDGDDITFENGDGRMTVNVEQDVMDVRLQGDNNG